MMKKILIGIIAIMLVSACSLVGRRPGEKEIETVDYHKGTDGLVLSILKGSPPEKIWPGSDFIVGIELKNKGAYNIENGKIKVHGFNPKYVLPSENEKNIGTLYGKSLGYPEGDYKIIQFEETNIAAPPGKEHLSFTVTAEYDYATEVGTEVCISPELSTIIKTLRTVCEIKEINLVGGQGAPVAVTKINEIPSYKGMNLNLDFIIDVENIGKGDVLGEINLEYVKLGGQVLVCDQTYFNLKEEDKKARVKCELNIVRPTGPYTSVLTAKFSYRYKTKIDGRIEVISG